MAISFQENQGGNCIPNWVLLTQILMFSILYAVWSLPETILIRHICLTVGAIIGAYEIYQFRDSLLKRLNSSNLPTWVLLSLFMWISFHLFFLSNNFYLQMQEYTGIWKRTALGAIFALGLGLTLGSQNPRKQKVYWSLLYLGLLAPTLIYILKYLLSHYESALGINVPEYLKLHYGAFPFYIPKTAYVCFCLPTLAASLSQLKLNIGRQAWLSLDSAIYALTIPAVLFVFYSENIKNGVAYGAFLILIFVIQIFLVNVGKYWIKKTLFVAIILMAGAGFLVNHIQKNESWRTLTMDAPIAMDTSQYDHWKFNGAKGYPINELGKMVSITNYERIAWGKQGLMLLAHNPLGYGLIERSFGHLAKQEWPDSTLHQSHSGWLDLALGIGLPGIAIVVTALLLNMRLLRNLQELENKQKINPNETETPFKAPWPSCCWWILLANLVMWLTTEISQKVFFDSLIFWIALASGLTAAIDYQKRGLLRSYRGNRR
jgi:hypothetical protein